MPQREDPFATYDEVHLYFKLHARRTREDTGRFVKLAHNTILRQRIHYDRGSPTTWYMTLERDARGFTVQPPDYEVVLHDTPILTFHSGCTSAHLRNAVTVRMGGWYTETTRNRINTYLPHCCLHVRQDKGLVTMHQWDGTGYLYGDSRNLGPFIEGITLGLDGRLPKQALTEISMMSTQALANAQLERQINRLVRKVHGKPGRTLLWEQEVERRGILWCDDCVRGEWDREHLLRHVQEGRLSVELVEHACKEIDHATRYNWRGNGSGAAQAARLRAYLRETLLVGPYVTKSGRRLPHGGVEKARGWNQHALVR